MLRSVPAHCVEFWLSCTHCCLQGIISTNLLLLPGHQPDTCLSWLELSLLGDRVGSVLFWGITTWERSCFGRENRSEALRNFQVVFIISWMLVVLPGNCLNLPGWDLWSLFAFAAILTMRGSRCLYFCSAQPLAKGTGCMRFINKYLLFWVMTEREGISWLWMTSWKSWNLLALGCQEMPIPRSRHYFFPAVTPALLPRAKLCLVTMPSWQK